MPYFAGLKTVECSAIRNSTTSINSTLCEKNAAMPQRHHRDLEDLDPDQHRALADGVGQVAGVAGEQQERQHEDGAGQRQIFAALVCAADDWTARMETMMR